LFLNKHLGQRGRLQSGEAHNLTLTKPLHLLQGNEVDDPGSVVAVEGGMVEVFSGRWGSGTLDGDDRLDPDGDDRLEP
jgi:hypothetical protein